MCNRLQVLESWCVRYGATLIFGILSVLLSDAYGQADEKEDIATLHRILELGLCKFGRIKTKNE